MKTESIVDMLRLLAREVKGAADEALRNEDIATDTLLWTAYQDLYSAIDHLTGEKLFEEKILYHAHMMGKEYVEWRERDNSLPEGSWSVFPRDIVIVRVMQDLGDDRFLIDYAGVRTACPAQFLNRIYPDS